MNFKELKPINKKEMPSPNENEINSDLFNCIYNVIKKWDINASEYYNGYCSGNGSHVKLILDEIYPLIREIKIDLI